MLLVAKNHRRLQAFGKNCRRVRARYYVSVACRYRRLFARATTTQPRSIKQPCFSHLLPHLTLRRNLIFTAYHTLYLPRALSAERVLFPSLMSQPSGGKRTRLDSEGSDDESSEDLMVAGQELDWTKLRHDKELWYEDGTIILIAGAVAFKVHHVPLTTYSPVFKDMLSLPQPDTSSDSSSAAQDTQLPVVNMLDSPQDLRRVLRFLMPSGEIG